MNLNVNNSLYCAPLRGSVAVEKASVAKESAALSLKKGSVAMDSVAFKSDKQLSVPQMQNIIKSAKTTAAGWGVFFPVVSPLYFIFRSKNTIAKKYNLDKEQDKALINKIKNEQIKSSLPAFLFGAHYFISPIVWLVNKCSNPAKIDVSDIAKK